MRPETTPLPSFCRRDSRSSTWRAAAGFACPTAPPVSPSVARPSPPRRQAQRFLVPPGRQGGKRAEEGRETLGTSSANGAGGGKIGSVESLADDLGGAQFILSASLDGTKVLTSCLFGKL